MMLPDGLPELYSEARKNALTQIFILGFQAGYTHSESQGEGMCQCVFCKQAYADPEFAKTWAANLADFGFAPMP